MLSVLTASSTYSSIAPPELDHQPLFPLVSQAFVNPHEIAFRIFPATGEVESLRGFERPVRTLDGEKAELLVQIKNTLHALATGRWLMHKRQCLVDGI